MTLTINFVDRTIPRRPTLLATCNLNIDTATPQAVKDAYANIIPKVQQGFKGNGAQLMMAATEKVKEVCPDMILLGVNDDRPQSAPAEYTLVIGMSRKV